MYQKIYIHATGLDKPEELKKFSFLFNKDDPYKIWEYSMKVGKSYEWVVYDVGVFEIFLFHCELRAQGYQDDQIEILLDDPLFLHNDELYVIQNGVCCNLQTQNVGFFSVRPSSWRHPFFFLLKEVIEKQWWKMKRTNNLRNEIGGKWKLYGLQKLMSQRENYLGDILIPYGVKEPQMDTFYGYIKKNFSTKVVLKKDYGCAGKTVYVMDLSNDDPKQKDRLVNAMKGHEWLTAGVYLTPYYDFEEEYRFYFNKLKGEITLHSMKKKIILSDFEYIVSCETFQYYKNIKLKWEYIANQDWSNYIDIVNKAYQYLKKLDYTTGTLEFGKTKEGKIVFFEVNSMSATLCFWWEDTNNMQWYYEKIFQDLLFYK